SHDFAGEVLPTATANPLTLSRYKPDRGNDFLRQLSTMRSFYFSILTIMRTVSPLPGPPQGEGIVCRYLIFCYPIPTFHRRMVMRHYYITPPSELLQIPCPHHI